MCYLIYCLAAWEPEGSKIHAELEDEGFSKVHTSHTTLLGGVSNGDSLPKLSYSTENL